MIRLDVEEYCHGCLDFSPDVTMPVRYFIGNQEAAFSDTTVQCEYRKRCAGIKRYLERYIKSESEASG